MRCGPIVALLLSCIACSTAPVAPMPAPLAESLAWRSEELRQAFLGLDVQENSSGGLSALSFEPGVQVMRVVANSPAAESGITPGDVVLAVDGEEVDDEGALDVLVQRAGPEATIHLDVLRGDTVHDVTVVLETAGGRLPPVEPLSRLDPSRSRAGWSTAMDGVRLVTAADDSPFPLAGVPVGSTVLALDGETLLSDRQLVRTLQEHEPGSRVTVDVRLPDGTRSEQQVELLDQPTRVTKFGLPILMLYEAEADGSASSFSFFDIWILELFSYRREGKERHWVLLELFGWEVFPFSTGVGELTE